MPDIPPLPELPEAVRPGGPLCYVPSPAWGSWTREAFIARGAPLENEDHEMLQVARIGVLLTDEKNTTGGKRTIGQARLCKAGGADAWAKGQRAQQLAHWFSGGNADLLPDFMLTLDARWIADHARRGEPAPICALIEHELYHCGQKTRGGSPLFQQSGRPQWAIIPHDVEEFTGVVRRWGAEATQTSALVEAANAGPSIAPARLDGICGTCGRAL